MLYLISVLSLCGDDGEEIRCLWTAQVGLRAALCCVLLGTIQKAVMKQVLKLYDIHATVSPTMLYTSHGSLYDR
jgi:hypothetical protein